MRPLRFFTKDALFVGKNLGKHSQFAWLRVSSKKTDGHKTYYTPRQNCLSNWFLNEAVREIVRVCA